MTRGADAFQGVEPSDAPAGRGDFVPQGLELVARDRHEHRLSGLQPAGDEWHQGGQEESISA